MFYDVLFILYVFGCFVAYYFKMEHKDVVKETAILFAIAWPIELAKYMGKDMYKEFMKNHNDVPYGDKKDGDV